MNHKHFYHEAVLYLTMSDTAIKCIF